MKSFLKFIQTVFDSVAWFIGTIFLTGSACLGVLGLYIIGANFVNKIVSWQKAKRG